jgi:membrane dipeptidase
MSHKAVLAAVSALALSACASALPSNSGAAGVSPSAMAIHQKLLTLDTHLDTPAFFDTARGYDIMKRHRVERDGTQIDAPRMREGGLDGGFWAIYMGAGPLTPEGYANVRDRALIRSTSIHKMVAANPGAFEWAYTPDDARRINAKGKIFVFMSMENSYEIGDDITLVDTFYKLGVRLASPVHNGTNQLADSTNGEAKWGGLSPLGKQWLKRCNELGIMIDGSHSSNQTISQMIDLSATPLVLSHHGASGLFAHPRNSPDDLLKKLAAKGGVIQMNTLFIKTLTQTPERTAAMAELSKKWGGRGGDNVSADKYEAYLDELEALNKKYPEQLATFEDYMKQILYTLKLIGPEHVGLGADWDGGGGLDGYRDISYLPKVTERLLREGYTQQDLAHIMGGNVLRVMQQTQDYAKSLKN